MSKPVKADVELILRKDGRAAKMRAAIREAWEEVKADPDLHWWRRKSTRAGKMWECAVRNLIAAFGDDAGVHIEPHYDTVSFIFDDRVLIRFKKGDTALYTRNVSTQLALAFHQHSEDLFGHEGLQRVELVYVLSRFEASLDWLGIVARQRRTILWPMALDEIIDEGGAVIEPLPLPEPVSPAEQARLKPDVAAEIEQDEGEADKTEG